MREWRGGPEVICHSPPSFASPGPRSCVVFPLVRVSFVRPFAAVVSATPAAAADVDVAVAVAAAVCMPALALSCCWRWRHCLSSLSFTCWPAWSFPICSFLVRLLPAPLVCSPFIRLLFARLPFTHSPFVCSPFICSLTGGSCWQLWGWLTTERVTGMRPVWVCLAQTGVCG
jgi:hypothetical protein